MTNLLTLGISPCPNDTFIFDAMVNGKIDTEGLSFDVVMTDVEELNQKAFKNELDITKLSRMLMQLMIMSCSMPAVPWETTADLY